MKSNLIKGMIFISAIALSSCSSTNKLASMKNAANDDDVYYTHAKAGDLQQYMADNSQQTAYANTRNDDYYYYGDYAARLNRFSSISPFDYDDDFYYSYVPYNNGFGAGVDNLKYADYNNGYNTPVQQPIPLSNGFVYSPYDYGYSPYYDMGYDYGYGDIYSAFVIGGGGGGGGGSYIGGSAYSNPLKNSIIAGTTNPNARGVRTTPSPGVTRIGAALPGRPTFVVNTTAGTVTRTGSVATNALASRQTRDYNSQTPQSVSRPASTSTSSGSVGGGSSGAGGGGRPGRP